MKIIEPHIHMVSRTTDDYQALALAGIGTVTEPAFWAGFDRRSVDGFHDYFNQLTVTEPKRAAHFGIRHYSWVCLNPKEAEDLALAEDVLAVLPHYLDRPTVLGIGEIGLNRNSRNELKVLERHIELAARRNELILVHTPHLEDKLKGTRLKVIAGKSADVIFTSCGKNSFCVLLSTVLSLIEIVNALPSRLRASSVGRNCSINSGLMASGFRSS